jgi:hypothetical protein
MEPGLKGEGQHLTRPTGVTSHQRWTDRQLQTGGSTQPNGQLGSELEIGDTPYAIGTK